ncbi:TSUP family transporter [Bacteroidota bacterium]
MEYIVISAVALFVSGLTFFSGFGLGTLLMPAFALFVPVEVAIAATAIVHLANNLFKLILIGKYAVIKIVIKFAIPAAITAALGAWLLGYISDLNFVTSYSILGHEYYVTPVKLIISILMTVFALFELVPALKNFSIKEKYIPLGGLLSGLFGGISGHQGALRTAFLIHSGLEKRELIGTMVTCAIIVDFSRILIYGITFFQRNFIVMQEQGIYDLIIIGTIAAFLGALIGRRLLDKITLKGIHLTVGIMLLTLALGLGSGLI